MIRRRRNSDASLRDLERRVAASPDDADLASSLVQANMRAGRVQPWLVELAARVGHQVAIQVLGGVPEEPRWTEELRVAYNAALLARRWDLASHHSSGSYVRGLPWWEDNPGVEEGTDLAEGQLDAEARVAVLSGAQAGDSVALETIADLGRRGRYRDLNPEYPLVLLGGPVRRQTAALEISSGAPVDVINGPRDVELEFRLTGTQDVAYGRYDRVTGVGNLERAPDAGMFARVAAAISRLDVDTLLDAIRLAAYRGATASVGDWAFVGGTLGEVIGPPTMTVEGYRRSPGSHDEESFDRLAKPVLARLADAAFLDLLDATLGLPVRGRLSSEAITTAAANIQRWRTRPRTAWFELVPKKIREAVGKGNVDPATARDEDLELPAYAWPGGYDMLYQYDDDELLCHECANAHAEPWTITGWSTSEIESGSFVVCDVCNRVIVEGDGDEDGDDENADD